MTLKRHNTNTQPKFQKGPTFVFSQFLHIHSYVTSIQETSKIMRINVTFLRHWQTHLSQPGSLCMHPKCSMSRDKRRKSPVQSKRKRTNSISKAVVMTCALLSYGKCCSGAFPIGLKYWYPLLDSETTVDSGATSWKVKEKQGIPGDTTSPTRNIALLNVHTIENKHTSAMFDLCNDLIGSFTTASYC